jgi:hypothetical protein
MVRNYLDERTPDSMYNFCVSNYRSTNSHSVPERVNRLPPLSKLAVVRYEMERLLRQWDSVFISASFVIGLIFGFNFLWVPKKQQRQQRQHRIAKQQQQQQQQQPTPQQQTETKKKQ